MEEKVSLLESRDWFFQQTMDFFKDVNSIWIKTSQEVATSEEISLKCITPLSINSQQSPNAQFLQLQKYMFFVNRNNDWQSQRKNDAL